MKKTTAILLCFSMLLVFAACGSAQTASDNGALASSAPTLQPSAPPETAVQEAPLQSESVPEDTPGEGASRILIAYFSRADENYGVGYIEKGNTAIIAEMIAEQTDGELFHIERSTPYPKDYDECTDEAKREQNENARPELMSDHDIEDYDVIFLGYPNWWGDMPMAVYTWLEAHDFTGKTIVPFCTHAGSGLGGTARSIQGECPGATLLDGFAITGVTAQNRQEEAKAQVLEWLNGLDLQ